MGALPLAASGRPPFVHGGAQGAGAGPERAGRGGARGSGAWPGPGGAWVARAVLAPLLGGVQTPASRAAVRDEPPAQQVHGQALR